MSRGATPVDARGRRGLVEQLSREEAERRDAARETFAGVRVDVNAEHCCLERGRAARGEPTDDACEHVARAARAEAHVAATVLERRSARRGDECVWTLQHDDDAVCVGGPSRDGERRANDVAPVHAPELRHLAGVWGDHDVRREHTTERRRIREELHRRAVEHPGRARAEPSRRAEEPDAGDRSRHARTDDERVAALEVVLHETPAVARELSVAPGGEARDARLGHRDGERGDGALRGGELEPTSARAERREAREQHRAGVAIGAAEHEHRAAGDLSVCGIDRGKGPPRHERGGDAARDLGRTSLPRRAHPFGLTSGLVVMGAPSSARGATSL